MTKNKIETGHIVDTSKTPEKVLNGTQYRKLEDLDRIISFLDMFRINTLISKKVIQSAKEYKSPFKVRENRPYYAGDYC